MTDELKAAPHTHVAEQCRALGINVGDTIEGRETGRYPDQWNESRLTLLWAGETEAMWLERSRTSIAPEWFDNGETSMWTLDGRTWRVVSRAESLRAAPQEPPITVKQVNIVMDEVFRRVRIEFTDDERAAFFTAMKGWRVRQTGPANADGSIQFAVLERAQEPSPLSVDSLDAARYRWIKSTAYMGEYPPGAPDSPFMFHGIGWVRVDKLDAAIDAALAEQKGTQ